LEATISKDSMDTRYGDLRFYLFMVK
jgi:hypothetical protein